MESFPEFKTYAQQLVDLARWAYRNNWAPGTSTNYSVRLPQQAAPAFCAITSSGVDKKSIEVEHIVAVDSQGRPVDGKGLRPSAETLLHMMLYKTLDAGAVFHTHSIAATLLSKMASDQGSLILSGWEILKGLNGIDTHEAEVVLPIFPNDQDMTALAALIEPRLMKERPVFGFLIAGHGLYVWGHDLNETKRHLEVYEFVLQCEREVKIYGQASNSRKKHNIE